MTDLYLAEEQSSAYMKQVSLLENNKDLQSAVKHGKRIGFYSFAQELGSGNFSRVVVAYHDLTKARVAMKIIKKGPMDKKTKRLLSHEVINMEKLHHPNIIQLFEVIHTPTKLYLAMELAEHGELLTRINIDGRLNEEFAKLIFSQITSAVQHMHQHHVVHRDLKAENVIFVGKNRVKVGDFGFSCSPLKFGTAMTTYCGSPPYAAPELFSSVSYEGEMVDVWAMGVLLYFMVSGSMPFRADTMGKLKKLIISGEYSIPSHLSSYCVQLLNEILTTNYQNRATISHIISSEWLRDIYIPRADQFYRKDPSHVRIENSHTNEALAILSMEKLGLTKKMISETSLSRPWSSNQEMPERVKNQKLICGVNERTVVIGCYRIFLHQHHQRLANASYRERNAVEKMIELKISNNETTNYHQRSRSATSTCQFCQTTVDRPTNRQTTPPKLHHKPSQHHNSKPNKSLRSRFCVIL